MGDGLFRIWRSFSSEERHPDVIAALDLLRTNVNQFLDQMNTLCGFDKTDGVFKTMSAQSIVNH